MYKNKFHFIKFFKKLLDKKMIFNYNGINFKNLNLIVKHVIIKNLNK